MAAGRLSSSIILKEGFLYKKGGVIKSWSRRFFVLSPQSLCYFRSEDHDQMEPLGRIFLSDIVSISTEGVEKKKAFVFVLHTKKRAVLLQGANTEDRDKWVQMIQQSLETEKEAENHDPFRKSLRRLAPGIKRVTLFKDPQKGIGCTIKNAAGHIFVSKILEDGPIAETGILRPGDELLDLHGHPLGGLLISEITDIIRDAPREFLATVRPVTSVHKALKQDFSRTNYVDIVHAPKAVSNGTKNGSGSPPRHDSEEDSCEDATYAVIKKASPTHHSRANGRANKTPSPPTLHVPVPRGEHSNHTTTNGKVRSEPSYEDVGNYDDEDEGDTPPPLPAWTEDAFILVDPPPSTCPKPKFDIYKTNAHLPDGVVPQRSPCLPPKLTPLRSTPPALASHFSTPTGHTPRHRRSPPTQPPATPPKLYKAHSQGDGLDQIDSRPPVPPRHHGRNPAVFYSPGCKPRRAHKYEDIDHLTVVKKTPNYIDLDFTSKRRFH